MYGFSFKIVEFTVLNLSSKAANTSREGGREFVIFSRFPPTSNAFRNIPSEGVNDG